MPEKERKRSKILVFLLSRIVLVATFLMLYMLSIGPMFWYWYEAKHLSDGDFLSRVIVGFYEPLRFACKIPIVENIINNYILWWAM